MQDFNYRQHLINIHQDLQYFVNELYAYGLRIGEKGELSDMHKIFEVGDEIPGDLDILWALESEAVAGFVKIIESLFEIQASLVNLNALSEEELELSKELESEEDPEEENELPDLGVYLNAQRFVYGELLNAFLATWQLAHQTEEVPESAISLFDDYFFDGKLELASEDANVQLLMEGINEILELNREINYYEDEDEDMDMRKMGWTME
ncbi:hypothetical protein [Desertivirga brevis]|uniref:hypothetical protein n=1 Tax=Desertivirga brevis TaxID=2810310 RepID=UPI001A9734A6|nr:hypothetical protein [Pedobacter sp. SYSU D00873]